VASAGQPVNTTVTALDQYNNSVGSAYTGSIHFSTTDTSATSPANSTLASGTGIFATTFKTAGIQTVSVTDTGLPGLIGTSNPIVVSAAASQFAVSAPASVTTGSSFLVTVTALDATGHTATGYSGTVQLASTDSQAVLQPASAALANGVGTFLATLKSVAGGPWTISVKDTQAPTIAGTSDKITVTPAAASFFTVVAPAGTKTTGAPFSATVTALDAFGNIASGYGGQVRFTSSDSKAVLPSDSKLSGGVGTFDITLSTAGTQTITATDNALTNPLVTGSSGPLTTRGLTVSSFTPTATGFTAVFSKPLVPADLSLYGTGVKTVPDVTLVGAHTGQINGSLIIDASNTSITFNATASYLSAFFDSPVLPDDTYTVTMVSGSGTNGFMDALGTGLDGTNTGGHADYTTTFATTFQTAKTPVLGMPDFARGPNNGDLSLPVTLYNVSSVTDATFTLNFNPALLSVKAASTADSTGTGSKTFTLVSSTSSDSTHATASFHYTSTTAQNGTVVVGDIVVSVPASAGSVYKAKELLQLGSVTVNSAAFAGAVANAVHVNAYFGDVSGNGTIDGLDVATATNLAQGKDTGFAAYQLLDPAIVGDVANDGSVDAGAISTLAAFVSHLPTPQIPAIPTGVTITPLGADPTLTLGQAQKQGGGSDARFTVPILLDDPHPEGSTGMMEAVLALTYDPAVLNLSPQDIVVGSMPGLSGWQLASKVDQAAGQLVITLYNTTPLTTREAGSLVDVSFHLVPGSSASTAAVQMVNSLVMNGRQFSTQVDDAQGQLVLSPGVSRLDIGTGIAFSVPIMSIRDGLAATRAMPNHAIPHLGLDLGGTEIADGTATEQAPRITDVFLLGSDDSLAEAALPHPTAAIVALSRAISLPRTASLTESDLWSGWEIDWLAGSADPRAGSADQQADSQALAHNIVDDVFADRRDSRDGFDSFDDL
jgi:hypothetical protein